MQQKLLLQSHYCISKFPAEVLGYAKLSCNYTQVISPTVYFNTHICLQPGMYYDKGQKNKLYNLLPIMDLKSRHGFVTYGSE